jgi:hypothetical protein
MQDTGKKQRKEEAAAELVTKAAQFVDDKGKARHLKRSQFNCKTSEGQNLWLDYQQTTLDANYKRACNRIQQLRDALASRNDPIAKLKLQIKRAQTKLAELQAATPKK